MIMPGMGGMELARKMKTDPALSPTRLVLLTSLGQRGDGADVRKGGIEAFLTKPARQSDLYDALATVMGAFESAPEEGGEPVTCHGPARGEEALQGAPAGGRG